MSSSNGASASEEAVNWVILLQDPSFDDWENHLAWLDANPSHAELYRDAALSLADGLVELDGAGPRKLTVPANDDSARDIAPAWRRRGGWATAAIAASAAFVLIPHRGSQPADAVFATSPGQTRTVRLADGTSIALNGDTAIRVVAGDPRRVRLERGEVFVNVVHDANRPFQLTTAQGNFRDIGTAFNVRSGDGAVRLTVADGAVAYDPEEADIHIGAGRSLLVAGHRAVLGEIQRSSVGSWRSGRLVYADVDLRSIATDLSRSLGVKIHIADRVMAKRFTGVIPLDGPSDGIVNRFARLVQLTAVRENKGWQIDSGPGSRPARR